MSSPSPNPPVQDTKTAGFADIFTNLTFSASLAAILLIFFCALRRYYKTVFARNLAATNKPDGPYVVPYGGAFKWLLVLWKMDDTTLLAMVGLDGFICIQVPKLLGLLLAVIGVPAMGILLPCYYGLQDSQVAASGPESTPAPTSQVDLFHLLSIQVMPRRYLWIPVLLCYPTTAALFYFVYSFWRSILGRIQAYLHDAASFTSYAIVSRKAGAFGGNLEAARAELNAPHRCLIIHGVSAAYSAHSLAKDILEPALGPILHCQFLHSKHRLKQLLEKRNSYLSRLESEYRAFAKRIQHARAFEDPWDAPRLSVSQRCQLVERIHDPQFLPELRPKHHRRMHHATTEQNPAVVDAIAYFYGALRELDRQYEALLARFVDAPLTTVATGSSATASQIGSRRGTGLLGDSVVEASVMRVQEDEREGRHDRERQIKNLRHEHYHRTIFADLVAVWDTLRDFRLTMWGTSRSVVVQLAEVSGAAAGRQVVLSGRPLSLLATTTTPHPDDLLWSNVSLPPADRLIRRIGGEIIYGLLFLFFIPISAFLGSLLELEQLEAVFPWITVATESSPWVRNVLRGILAPLGLSLSLLLLPPTLHALSLYQAMPSKTEVEGWVMVRYGWFLLAQLLLIGFFPGQDFLQLLNRWLRNGPVQSWSGLQENLPTKAVFFINLILQKTFITTMVSLAKPLPVLLSFTSASKKSSQTDDVQITSAKDPNNPITAKNSTETEQAQTAQTASPSSSTALTEAGRHDTPSLVPFVLRTVFPEQTLFVFHMCMAFVLMTPVFVIPGLLFFTISYWVTKANLVFNEAVMVESGGAYWSTMSQQILASAYLTQVFLLFQLLVNGCVVESILMVPLLILTAAGIPAMHRIFARKATHPAATAEDSLGVLELLREMEARQRMLLPESDTRPVSLAHSVPVDLTKYALLLESAGGGSDGEPEEVWDADPQAAANPYADPLRLRRPLRICLPPALLSMVDKILQEQRQQEQSGT